MAYASDTLTDVQQRVLQYKIHQLEKSLLSFYEDVQDQIKGSGASGKIIDMRDTKRKTHEDGLYMITLNLRGSECHAVMIYKETPLDEGPVKLYIYDSNGRTSANEYNYEANIRLSRAFEVDYCITPDRSINDDGYCALWCIVSIILWNSFPPDERITALSLFNDKMRESRKIRTQFMDGIRELLIGDLSSESSVSTFIKQVEKQIIDLCIDF